MVLEGFRPDAAAGGQLIGQREAPTVLESGRVCAQETCGTHLSIYNPDAYCALHSAFRSTRRTRVRARANSRGSAERLAS